jgi:hypothetical protein
MEFHGSEHKQVLWRLQPAIPVVSTDVFFDMDVLGSH